MSIDVQKVLLIVPCYNEENRLQQEVFLKETPLNVDILFANDGSSDQTQKVIDKLCIKRSGFYSYHGQNNRGKSNVIRDAFLFYKQTLKQQYDWIGFWDADLATPLQEVSNFLIYRNTFSKKSLVLFGCRLNRYGANIKRSPIRHYLSRVFVTFTDLLLGVKAYDSQCGAKLFHQSVVNKAFEKPFVSKWIFDIEFILRIGAENILEVPVFKWEDVPGSKMRIGRESFRVLRDIFKIRKTYLK